ncbi:CPBP family intramembrane glutamic endopeptidase [Metabacillus iocasae]|uniref:Membrane protease YdiL (CAAX protease family) n=1 Tax=Priestia iocasae TaxID=2291674 RepID=A0ABS2QZ21_9BACI|nr:type II CAAX endopeptidase family protein [Metabacillus iocasae]MBM7704740.1 membrane protease YdiL (CAAX protease family) [Metabacillus iocasae]
MKYLILFCLAHLGFYLSFGNVTPFWYTFPIVYAALITLSRHSFRMTQLSLLGWMLSVGSGLLLYGLFFIGSYLLAPLAIDPYIDSLYTSIAPTKWWQHIALLFIIIPGEEIVWRGFLYKKLAFLSSPFIRIALATTLYTSVHLYALNPLLLLAAVVGGAVWGYLYEKTKRLSFVIISHLVFDFLLLYLLPLN